MRSRLFTEDHEAYRETVREFVAREVTPHLAQWDEDHLIPRDVWLSAGEKGLLGILVPEDLGGGGQQDFRYRIVASEELAKAGAAALASGFSVQDDIVIPYIHELGTPEQHKRWLPGLAAGGIISAIAMTEPGAGSDLQGIRSSAVRDGDEWVINGAKTFITNGIQSDIVVLAARTDPAAGSRGFSLFVVERGMPGFTRGRKLEKVGLQAQDTAELFFDNVRVPAANLLGTEGRGLIHLMERLPRERLSIAMAGQTSAEAVFQNTRDYVFDRTAFGQPIGNFQNTRFVLAELLTDIEVGRAYLDKAVLELNAGTLTAVDAAKAKWWITEMQNRVIDRCVQLHGGYGYMLEYPVARAFIDARIQTIYGGTTEIMKEIIGREIAGPRKP